MKTKSIILTTVVILLSGCASSKMLVQDNQELVPPVADQSQIVFLRSTFVGSAIQSSVFDVTSGEPEFVGIVSNDTKLAYTVSPGEHVFMVVSEAADFMQAKPGRRKNLLFDGDTTDGRLEGAIQHASGSQWRSR